MSVRKRGRRPADDRPRSSRDDVYRWIDAYVIVDAPRASFLTGIASLWDFAGALRPRVRVRPEVFTKTTGQALQEAWEAVGRDLAGVTPPMDEMADRREGGQEQS